MHSRSRRQCVGAAATAAAAAAAADVRCIIINTHRGPNRSDIVIFGD